MIQTKETSETSFFNILNRRVKDVCASVLEQYKIPYSTGGMISWLKHHHFVFKSPVNVPGRLDLEKHSQTSKIDVILDNGRANKTKRIQEYLKTSRIYSSRINLRIFCIRIV